jgi:hypothetical protein
MLLIFAKGRIRTAVIVESQIYKMALGTISLETLP